MAVLMLLISRLSGHPRYYELDAEEVRFELTIPCGTTVFKTVAFNHSATPPYHHSDTFSKFSSNFSNVPKNVV